MKCCWSSWHPSSEFEVYLLLMTKVSFKPTRFLQHFWRPVSLLIIFEMARLDTKCSVGCVLVDVVFRGVSASKSQKPPGRIQRRFAPIPLRNPQYLVPTNKSFTITSLCHGILLGSQPGLASSGTAENIVTGSHLPVLQKSGIINVTCPRLSICACACPCVAQLIACMYACCLASLGTGWTDASTVSARGKGCRAR